MAAENTPLLNASAIRCFPSPPTKILTFKEMMEKLLIFFLALKLSPFRAPRQSPPPLLPISHGLLSLVLAIPNPSAPPPLQSLGLRPVICHLQMTWTFLGWWLLEQFANLRQWKVAEEGGRADPGRSQSSKTNPEFLVSWRCLLSRHLDWRGGVSVFLLAWIIIFVFW